jgi:hypothetical protein
MASQRPSSALPAFLLAAQGYNPELLMKRDLRRLKGSFKKACVYQKGVGLTADDTSQDADLLLSILQRYHQTVHPSTDATATATADVSVASTPVLPNNPALSIGDTPEISSGSAASYSADLMKDFAYPAIVSLGGNIRNNVINEQVAASYRRVLEFVVANMSSSLAPRQYATITPFLDDLARKEAECVLILALSPSL